MTKKKPQKISIHPRNKHKGNYDFDSLIDCLPELKKFVKPNKYNTPSINFFDKEAVKMLNKALLKKFYNIELWDIPKNFLCPPIPGRADYIHHMADFLATQNQGTIPTGKNIKVLDIGVGANCIYPILGNAEYGWSYIGSEINKASIDAAQRILDKNKQLKDAIALRHQKQSKHIFKGVVQKQDKILFTMCNPPFHSSSQEAQKATLRKLNNLKKQESSKLERNFGGQHNELWCQGGELRFIKTMLIESQAIAQQVQWFSTLVSKEAHLKTIYQMLKKAKVNHMKTIKMAQGNKQSRVVVWSFLPRN